MKDSNAASDAEVRLKRFGNLPRVEDWTHARLDTRGTQTPGTSRTFWRAYRRSSVSTRCILCVLRANSLALTFHREYPTQLAQNRSIKNPRFWGTKPNSAGA